MDSVCHPDRTYNWLRMSLSLDGKNFFISYDFDYIKDGPSLAQWSFLAPTTARFVRVRSSGDSKDGVANFFELEVYGPNTVRSHPEFGQYVPFYIMTATQSSGGSDTLSSAVA